MSRSNWICYIKSLVVTVMFFGSVGHSVGSFDPNIAKLSDLMKYMRVLQKRIAKQVDSPELNAENARLSEELGQVAKIARTKVPDSIQGIPADEATLAQQSYQLALDQVIILPALMKQAFTAGDSRRARDLLDQLNQARKDGHAKFK